MGVPPMHKTAQRHQRAPARARACAGACARIMRAACLTILFLVAGLLTSSAGAQPRSPRSGESKPAGKLADHPNQVRGDEITPAQQAAVERGLAWLAASQGKNGAFGGQGEAGHAGITALAGLAFMQAGNLPGRGKYGENVQRCLDYVLSCCQES